MTMTVLIHGDVEEISQALRLRHERGLDSRDEIWDGVQHVTPYANSRHGRLEAAVGYVLYPIVKAAGLRLSGPVNIGVKNNFRIPDLAVREHGEDAVYLPTAVVVVEILSPDDESYAKIPFYFAHGIMEVLIVDPDTRTVECWISESERRDCSDTLNLTMISLAGMVDWS